MKREDLEAIGRTVGAEWALFDLGHNWTKWNEQRKARSAARRRAATPEHVVGITSQRPEEDPGHKTDRMVFKDMEVFKSALLAIPTVRDAVVKPGLGAWGGGREATWVTSYNGNGEALKLLQAQARKYDQDSVLMIQPGQGADPAHEITFETPLRERQMAQIGTMMAQRGLSGWSWFKSGGKTTLRAAFVPDWATDDVPTPEAFALAMRSVNRALNAKPNMRHRSRVVRARMTTLTREHDYQAA